MALTDKLTAIADAIRDKTGKTDGLTLDAMPGEIAGIVSGGGGADLNFEVVDGTSAPANASENTIWINTDQKITSWYLSFNEPPEPSEGMVWICVTSRGETEFNALKGNGIQIFPINGYQYTNNLWEKKPIKFYQNGEWVEFSTTHLFLVGNQFTNLTGGWVTANAGVVITIGNEIVADIVSGSNRDASAYTQNMIDVTEFSALACRVNKDTGIMNLGISRNNNSVLPSSVALTKTTVAGEQEVRVSLANVTGQYYVFAHFDVCEGAVSSVWLES